MGASSSPGHHGTQVYFYTCWTYRSGGCRSSCFSYCCWSSFGALGNDSSLLPESWERTGLDCCQSCCTAEKEASMKTELASTASMDCCSSSLILMTRKHLLSGAPVRLLPWSSWPAYEFFSNGWPFLTCSVVRQGTTWASWEARLRGSFR